MSAKQIERQHPISKPGLDVQPSSTTPAYKAARARQSQRAARELDLLKKSMQRGLGWASFSGD